MLCEPQPTVRRCTWCFALQQGGLKGKVVKSLPIFLFSFGATLHFFPCNDLVARITHIVCWRVLEYFVGGLKRQLVGSVCFIFLMGSSWWKCGDLASQRHVPAASFIEVPLSCLRWSCARVEICQPRASRWCIHRSSRQWMNRDTTV